MEKALDILKLFQSDKYKFESGAPLWKPELDSKMKEAIAELEEAMTPKTCDWCKQSWEPNNQTFHKYFCEYLKIPVHRGFYCNRYEPKDNAWQGKRWLIF